MRDKPEPGTTVRLTGEFLRNTGQQAGGEGHSKWIVVECGCGLCGVGKFLAVDEPGIDNPDRPRHINYANLEKCRPVRKAVK